MCSEKVCNSNQASRKVKEMAKALKDLKESSGTEYEQLKCSIIQKFSMDAKEKWVATKLRLMLIKLGSCKEFLAISCNGKQKSKGGKISQQKKATASRKYAGVKTYVMTVDSNPKIRKPRRSLEERQLTKLRALPNDEAKDEPARDSKLKFLEAFGLVPIMIAL